MKKGHTKNNFEIGTLVHKTFIDGQFILQRFFKKENAQHKLDAFPNIVKISIKYC